MAVGFIRDAGQRDLIEAARKTEGLINAITSYEHKWIDVRNHALGMANKALTRTARSFVLSNYNASGVDSKSGRLMNEINQIVAIMQIRENTRPQITVRFRKGIADYSKEDGGGSFYRAAGSVNYGAVRQNQNMNKLDKKTAKNKAYKQALKEGKAVVLDNVLVKVGRESKRKQAQKIRAFGSGISVTSPKHFFTLSGSQKSQLAEQGMNFFLHHMMAGLAAIK